MFEYNPINAQQDTVSDRQAMEKSSTLNNAALKQTGTDIQNKNVSPVRDFPADSAFISEEARKAFEKQDEIKRQNEMYDKWQKDALEKEKEEKKKQHEKHQKDKEKNKSNNPYQAYIQLNEEKL